MNPPNEHMSRSDFGRYANPNIHLRVRRNGVEITGFDNFAVNDILQRTTFGANNVARNEFFKIIDKQPESMELEPFIPPNVSNAADAASANNRWPGGKRKRRTHKQRTHKRHMKKRQTCKRRTRK